MAEVKDGVPVDENGKPMTKIMFHVAEKIGLPNYSNVEIGCSATKFVKDGDEIEGYRDLAQMLEKEVLGIERQKVLDAVKKQS